MFFAVETFLTVFFLISAWSTKKGNFSKNEEVALGHSDPVMLCGKVIAYG